jgi:hypothetical protein
MKNVTSLLVTGIPSDHFQSFSVTVTTESWSLQTGGSAILSALLYASGDEGVPKT